MFKIEALYDNGTGVISDLETHKAYSMPETKEYIGRISKLVWQEEITPEIHGECFGTGNSKSVLENYKGNNEFNTLGEAATACFNITIASNIERAYGRERLGNVIAFMLGEVETPPEKGNVIAYE